MESEINDYDGQCESSSFLESFNIDTGSESTPHFIVNLDKIVDASETEPVESSKIPIVPIQAPQLPPPTTETINIPTVPQYSPFVRIGTPKGRSRGSYKPLHEMVETRIRTYEGSDSHSKMATLMTHFPDFKRGIIDRCFTKNLLDFDKTYTELYHTHKQHQENMSKIKLILTPKLQKNKAARIIPNIKSPELINMPAVRGRPSRRAGNRYYRRVIVGKDGTVEPADLTEKKYVQNSDSFRASNFGLPKPNMRMQSSIPSHQSVENRQPIGSSPILQNQQAPTVVEPSSNNLNESAVTASEETVQTDTNEAIPPTASANKFFRSNRLSDTELKKRDYVTKELQGQATNRFPVVRLVKHDLDNNEPGLNSTANFMAGVGVVINQSTKKRGRKPRNQQKEVEPENPNQSDETEEEINDDLDLSKEERQLLMTFFNEAPSEELSLMPGCSQKTAEVIINLRPFKNTIDLKMRLAATRYLSANLIDSCKELMQTRTMFSSLLENCKTISERVGGRMSCLLTDSISLPVIDLNEPEGKPDQYAHNEKNIFLREQPVILHPLRQLKPYQLVGLNWLRILHNERVNGILADEMGLGKTVQAISFLAYLYENGERGPHLIVCPSSTIDNWKRELHNWCSQLKVLVYQGASDQRKAMRLKIYENSANPDFNILLTSYSVGTSTLEDRALMKRVNFQYGIFDEAHLLKNMTTQRYKTLSSFQIQRRLLLTGTPMQNNLMELISLLAFVMPDLFLTNAEHLKRMFQLMGKSLNEDVGDKKERKLSKEISENESNIEHINKNSILIPNRSQFERERLEQAKRLLQPFCLRRLKSQVLLQLPPKTEETIYVPFTETQNLNYINLVNQFRNANAVNNTDEDEVFEEDDASKSKLLQQKLQTQTNSTKSVSHKRQKISDIISGTGEQETVSDGKNNKLTPYNMLMQLRKASNHQLLLSGIAYTPDILKELSLLLHTDPSHCEANPNLILEDLSVLSDHQVHKVCRLYDVLNPFALQPELLIQGSGKITWFSNNLPRLLKEQHRVLIFSQLVIMLDILGEYLVNVGTKFLRIDGSTPVQDRQTLIDTFNSDETYEIFLLSTKAGGLGISLTGADVVILHDIDFNPYNDRQAADRCHRVGQTKPVHVIRLVSQNSVEESIWRTSEEKLSLEEDVTDFDREEEALSSHVDSQIGQVDKEKNSFKQQNTKKRPYENGSNLVESVDGQNEISEPITRPSNKQVLQGEIIKYLSDALSASSTTTGKNIPTNLV